MFINFFHQLKYHTAASSILFLRFTYEYPSQFTKANAFYSNVRWQHLFCPFANPSILLATHLISPYLSYCYWILFMSVRSILAHTRLSLFLMKSVTSNVPEISLGLADSSCLLNPSLWLILHADYTQVIWR